MSQTAQWASSGSAAERTKSGVTQGSGGNQRLYVGTFGGYQHRSFLRFTLPTDWTDYGQIKSAVLTVWTDDGLGDLDVSPVPPKTVRVPTVSFRRLTAAFSSHSSNAGFVDGDYSNPVSTTDGRTTPHLSITASGINNIDVTDIVMAWAPKSVKGPTGQPGKGIVTAGQDLGIVLVPDTDTNHPWAGFSFHYSDPAYRPYLTVTYEYGLTKPNIPGSLTPTGSIGALTAFSGSFSDVKATDELRFSQVRVYPSAATTADSGQTVTGATAIYDQSHGASGSEILAGQFTHVPDSLALVPNTTYKWQARTTDQEGQVSLWTNLTSFTVTNTAPTVGTLVPASQTYASLAGVKFSAVFADADAGDTMLAYQVQLSAYPSGDSGWLNDANILWNTGKVMATSLSINYGGVGLASGSYYWRVRVWDNHDTVSAWAYAAITVSSSFVVDPASVTTGPQLRLPTDSRIVLRAMKMDVTGGAVSGVSATNVLTSTAHGLAVNQRIQFSALSGGSSLLTLTDYYVLTVPTANTFTISTSIGGSIKALGSTVTAGVLTAVMLRGPGATVAILEDAENIGASALYNSPGDLHYTVGIRHPQISVMEPKQVHYSVQLRQGDGWREVYAGLLWDFDATDTDIVFYGIDYLSLLDYCLDEHYNTANPEQAAELGGSKYVTTGKNTIAYIVHDQLARAKALPNSPVGFIATPALTTVSATNDTVGGATMGETLVVYSTYQPTLSFITSLLDSHRAGQNKRTMISCQLQTDGSYSWVLRENPGTVRDNLRLRYGELVQGYRVVPFGNNWGSRVAAIGRGKNGVKVMYDVLSAPGIDETVWGHFAKATFIDGVNDENDLKRRAQQMATHQGKLGQQMGLGTRFATLNPRDGYDIPDLIPVDIEHGAVDTELFGSGYWAIMGITWQKAAGNGKTTTTLTLQPREDDTPPSQSGLLTLSPISPQAEWQVGYKPPDISFVAAKNYVDQSTGIVYYRDETVSPTVYTAAGAAGSDFVPVAPTAPTGAGAGSTPVVTAAPVAQQDGGTLSRVTTVWTAVNIAQPTARQVRLRVTIT